MSSQRMWFWNVLLVAVEATALVFAHCVGVPWSTLAAELTGLLLVGVAGPVYVVRVHVPRAHHRFEQRLQASLADRAALIPAEDDVRAAPPAAITRPPRRSTLPATSYRSADASDREARA